MRQIVALIVLIFLPICSWSQINLVLNPSFENHTACPDNEDEVTYSIGWTSLDSAWRAPDWIHDKSGVPEYCHLCASDHTVGIPSGAYFFQYCRTGNGMMQVQMYHRYNEYGTYDRDYLQGRFTHTLEAGRSYKVSFYAVGAGIFVVSKIGAYFDDGTIDTTLHPQWGQYHCHPQIVDTNIITDTANWVEVSGVYTATGNEKFITIGQFAHNYETRSLTYLDTTHLTCTPCDFYSWYLVDDVSVIDCATMPFAGNDTLIHPGDSVFLGTYEALIPWYWYQLGSSTAIDSGGGLWVHPTATTRYVVTQDICGDGIKADTITVHVWPDTPTVVHTIIDPININVYPNPTSSEFTIDGARGCTVEIINAIGQTVLQKEGITKRETIDISMLEDGGYMVVAYNPVSGVRVVRRIVKRGW